MDKVISEDGTPIAFERFGDGPPVILVGGASCDRSMMRPVAERLGRDLAAITYDRRGRGDSGDTAPYAVERELEDLGALIAEAGGTASVYGHSSGAGLALHAAANGLPIDRVVLHDPPYTSDDEEDRRTAREYGETLRTTLSEGRRGDAMALFMTLVGMPAEMVEEMRGTPRWAHLEALAPTLAYDSEVMGDISRGGTVPADVAGRVAPPALVLVGSKSPPFMLDTGGQLADALPNGSLRVLEGADHVVDPEVVAPVLTEFLG